ncbi:hypothetical protein DFH11DRAFT_1689188 [Phellopilus nigrolimitatus]|nr:hypothetical protein DFH11DRAFT_1689188 [Phellopilus nigrolimitatus]
MPAAVPKLVQRFRARELQRLVNATSANPSSRTTVFMRNTDVKNLKMHIPLHNPFLPRPLFNRALTLVEPESSEVQERKKWAQPKYSLRRQADLVKAARASGTLHLLPPGPKLSVEELQDARRDARRRARVAAETQRRARARTEEVSATTELEALETPSSASTLAQAPSPSQLGSSPRKRGKWVIRSAAQLAKRRNSATAGYPGVVFRWTGKVPEKAQTKAGRLTVYAGRKRMFKGHKWERNYKKRTGQINVRMRDMKKRIKRFKNVYKNRRANPLLPASPRRKESLPF